MLFLQKEIIMNEIFLERKLISGMISVSTNDFVSASSLVWVMLSRPVKEMPKMRQTLLLKSPRHHQRKQLSPHIQTMYGKQHLGKVVTYKFMTVSRHLLYVKY